MGNAPERIWFTKVDNNIVPNSKRTRPEDVEYVRADLVAPSWQPIETAPKDGTRILVYRTPEKGYQSKIYGVDAMIEGKWWYSRRDMQPTHWIPLPAPPEAD